MKLGLVIKITNGGESEGFSINKNDSWAHYATDARSAIKELSNFDASEKTVYLLKFLGTLGYLLCVIKARPEGSGRPNDNTAACKNLFRRNNKYSEKCRTGYLRREENERGSIDRFV